MQAEEMDLKRKNLRANAASGGGPSGGALSQAFQKGVRDARIPGCHALPLDRVAPCPIRSFSPVPASVEHDPSCDGSTSRGFAQHLALHFHFHFSSPFFLYRKRGDETGRCLEKGDLQEDDMPLIPGQAAHLDGIQNLSIGSRDGMLIPPNAQSTFLPSRQSTPPPAGF